MPAPPPRAARAGLLKAPCEMTPAASPRSMDLAVRLNWPGPPIGSPRARCSCSAHSDWPCRGPRWRLSPPPAPPGNCAEGGRSGGVVAVGVEQQLGLQECRFFPGACPTTFVRGLVHCPIISQLPGCREVEQTQSGKKQPPGGVTRSRSREPRRSPKAKGNRWSGLEMPPSAESGRPRPLFQTSKHSGTRCCLSL